MSYHNIEQSRAGSIDPDFLDSNKSDFEQAGLALGNECFAELSNSKSSHKDSLEKQFLDDKLSKLFDGEKKLEINGAGCNEGKKQDWLVVMNLATDFGGSCTIENRTKKLQELAAKTEGKDVAMVVQASVLDESSGKYKLERFVLKDGKVEKLKSPGESGGYGADVESLLSYAGKRFPAKNLGLILDSHGHGNEGLQGDSSDLSMSDFKKHVASALKSSGHEKLDFLQFDACLMAQNGVLEASQSIAKHIVASAEPEGVTEDTAAADNKNLEKLFANPKMTADEFAETCVKLAKDVNGFDTLAHFDMEKYQAFRKSLDGLGEELAKAWKKPEQEKVLRQIIKETFHYGVENFRIVQNADKKLDAVRAKPIESIKPEQSTEIQNQNQNTGRFGGLSEILNHVPRLFEKPESDSSPKPSFEDILPYLFNLGRRLGSEKRDLKEFVEKVVSAIDAGKLEDADGKLKEAAKAVLKESSTLTRSYFGRAEHRGLGGLSVYLPEAGGSADAATISKAGGWRQFQELLREPLKPEK